MLYVLMSHVTRMNAPYLSGMCMEAGNSALVQSAPAPPSPTMCDECKDIVKEVNKNKQKEKRKNINKE